MKFSTTTVFTTMIATASAFAPTSPKTASTTTSLSAEKSEALPFLERPAILDGTYPGDAGFDPLGLARNEIALESYRSAEIKHARLAMLAAAGWPLSELFDRKIANFLDMEPIVDASERAPSVLNGGLDRVSPLYWAAVLAGASYIEYIDLQKNDQASFPGDFGWDPLGLYPGDEEGQRRMQLAEIKNGRTAMVSFGFVVQCSAVSLETNNKLASKHRAGCHYSLCFPGVCPEVRCRRRNTQ